MTKVLVYEYISAGADAAADAMPELLAQGRAMRDAVAGDLVSIAGVEVTCVRAANELDITDIHAPELTWCQASPGHDAVAFVRAAAPRYDAVWVIAPETDGVLRALRDAVDASRWIGCDAASLRVASSKSLTVQHLAQARIATPCAWSALSPLQPRAGVWVVKPDDGAGAVGTYIYDDFEAASAAFHMRLAQGERVTFEEWIEGDPLSLSLLCCGGHAELLSVNRQHVSIVRGRLGYEGVTVDAIALDSPAGRDCAMLAARVACTLPGLAGFVGIDVVWHRERGPVVIEINPRVTGAYPGLSARPGAKLAARVLAMRNDAQAGLAAGSTARFRQVCHAA